MTKLLTALLAMSFICGNTNYAFASLFGGDDFTITDDIKVNMSLLTSEAHRLEGSKWTCDDAGMTIYDFDMLNDVSIPSVITKDTSTPTGGSGWATFSLVGGMVSPVIGAIYAGVSYTMAKWACNTTYVTMPHEFFNLMNGYSCKTLSDGSVVFCNGTNNDSSCDETDTGILTADDVPYFYHCNPYYDAIAETTLDPSDPDDLDYIGQVYGYAGAASQLCTGDMKQYGDMAESMMLPGKIILSSTTNQWSGNTFTLCGVGGDDRERVLGLTPGYDNKVTLKGTTYMGFYYQDDSTGKIYMCAATIGLMFTVVPTCGYIAPPAEDSAVDPWLKAYVSGTRCEYMLFSRIDLQSLGTELSLTDEWGQSRQSVINFLQSDFHFTSTVVGCVQDMLVKIFIKAPGTATLGTQPFFQKVQDRLKQIVMTVLVLYVALTGIKIMSSPEPPKKGEWMMMVLKFALVVYFALGNVFYEVDSAGEVKGIFPAMLSAVGELAGMFLEAQNSNELMGFCTYMSDGRNLLGERMYPADITDYDDVEAIETLDDAAGSIVATIGQTAVKLTVWDLVDCKLGNYLNFGSCQYTPSGFVVVWLVSASFWLSGTGFALALVSLIYCFLILLVIFRYAHTFIMTLIVITILVFLAPIFVPFALFEFTKGIFDKWLKTILGYMIYPGLMFAFLALMLATIDSIYYGNLDTSSQASTGAQFTDITTACDGVSSVYCVTMQNIGVTTSTDACDLYDSFSTTLVTQSAVDYIGDMNKTSDVFADAILTPLLEIMLFAFLFFLFMDSISGFMSVLLGVQDIGAAAKGSFNVFNAIGSAGAAVGNLAKKAGGGGKK